MIPKYHLCGELMGVRAVSEGCRFLSLCFGEEWAYRGVHSLCWPLALLTQQRDGMVLSAPAPRTQCGLLPWHRPEGPRVERGQPVPGRRRL